MTLHSDSVHIDKVTALKTRLSQFEQYRSPWEGLWQEITDYVNPKRGDFVTGTGRGVKRTTKIYDSTAPWALGQFASGLHGFLTSATQRWFGLRVVNPTIDERDLDIRAYLEVVQDIMYEEVFNSAATRWSQQSHEMYLDIGSYGTACIFTEDLAGKPILFKTFHLNECFIAENDQGFVDTLFRVYPRNGKQLVDRYGRDSLPTEVLAQLDKKPFKEFKILHAIYPRDELMFGAEGVSGMAFASDVVLLEHSTLLEEGGYHEFPAAVPRWYRTTGELYGRSPATEVLPDIKMVNEMMKTIIRGAQKRVDPPLQLPDDGFLMPIKLAPSALNYYRAGSPQHDRIQPIPIGEGNMSIATQLIDDRRAHIVRAFTADLMQLKEDTSREMTATEVIQRQEDRLRLIAPMVGRMQTEALGPLIMRVFAILTRRGMFPEPPAALENQALRIEYTSPVTLAQKATRLAGFGRMMDSITPVLELKPEIMDNFNADEFFHFVHGLLDLPPQTANEPDDVAAIREERASQERAAEQAELLSQAGPGVKALADATRQ